jgi:hypothetical protein
MNKVFLTFILFLITSSAFAADKSCYKQEFNPDTLKVFSHVEDYNSALQDWQAREPQHPGLVKLAAAYAIYRSEKQSNEALARIKDKRAHCYVGCRISQELDYRTAEYVGWYKEIKDIKDCNPESHFDPADFDATIDGAHMGQSQVGAAACLQACEQKY